MVKSDLCARKKVLRGYWREIETIKERKKHTFTKKALMEIAKKQYEQNIMQEMFWKWVI